MGWDIRIFLSGASICAMMALKETILVMEMDLTEEDERRVGGGAFAKPAQLERV